MVSKDNAQLPVYLVQDKLFRVWGKVSLHHDTNAICEGRFEPLPDFRYLRGRFAEYQSLTRKTHQHFFEIAALNNWMVKLEPKLVPVSGEEIQLISACVETQTHADDMMFYGLKLDHDDASLVSASLW